MLMQEKKMIHSPWGISDTYYTVDLSDVGEISWP